MTFGMELGPIQLSVELSLSNVYHGDITSETIKLITSSAVDSQIHLYKLDLNCRYDLFIRNVHICSNTS